MFPNDINKALATDSSQLSEYGPFIRQLQYSIGKSQMNFTGTVFCRKKIEIKTFSIDDLK